MAVSDILENFGATTALTVTLGGLAASTAGVGRQTSEVDNTTTKVKRAFISASIKLGTSPTANTAIYIFAIRNDNAGTPIRTDGAGASDAGWTRLNAKCIGVLYTGPSPATGTVLKGDWVCEDLGKKFAIGVVNSSGVALDATSANHTINYYLDNPQAQ